MNKLETAMSRLCVYVRILESVICNSIWQRIVLFFDK